MFVAIYETSSNAFSFLDHALSICNVSIAAVCFLFLISGYTEDYLLLRV